MAVGSEGFCMAYILPIAKCEFQMSTGEQGFISSVGYIGVILASHFWGFMADTWGRRNVLRVVLFLTFVVSLLSSFSLNSWMLIITRFGCGLRCVQCVGFNPYFKNPYTTLRCFKSLIIMRLLSCNATLVVTRSLAATMFVLIPLQLCLFYDY